MHTAAQASTAQCQDGCIRVTYPGYLESTTDGDSIYWLSYYFGVGVCCRVDLWYAVMYVKYAVEAGRLYPSRGSALHFWSPIMNRQ